jgi:hypothetical protein
MIRKFLNFAGEKLANLKVEIGNKIENFNEHLKEMEDLKKLLLLLLPLAREDKGSGTTNQEQDDMLENHANEDPFSPLLSLLQLPFLIGYTKFLILVKKSRQK